MKNLVPNHNRLEGGDRVMSQLYTLPTPTKTKCHYEVKEGQMNVVQWHSLMSPVALIFVALQPRLQPCRLEWTVSCNYSSHTPSQ